MVKGVLKSYHRYVKPAFEKFVRPTQKYADIIVPRGRPQASKQNHIAIDFIVHNLEYRLVEAGYKIKATAESPVIPRKLSLTVDNNQDEQAIFDAAEMSSVASLCDESTQISILTSQSLAEASDVITSIS